MRKVTGPAFALMDRAAALTLEHGSLYATQTASEPIAILTSSAAAERRSE